MAEGSRWRGLGDSCSIDEALRALLVSSDDNDDSLTSSASASHSDESVSKAKARELLLVWNVATLGSLRGVSEAQRRTLAEAWPRLGRELKRTSSQSQSQSQSLASTSTTLAASAGVAKSDESEDRSDDLATSTTKGKKSSRRDTSLGLKDKDKDKDKDSKDKDRDREGSSSGLTSPRNPGDRSPKKSKRSDKDSKEGKKDKDGKDKEGKDKDAASSSASASAPKWGSYEWMVQQQQLLEQGKGKTRRDDAATSEDAEVSALNTAATNAKSERRDKEKAARSTSSAGMSRSTRAAVESKRRDDDDDDDLALTVTATDSKKLGKSTPASRHDKEKEKEKEKEKDRERKERKEREQRRQGGAQPVSSGSDGDDDSGSDADESATATSTTTSTAAGKDRDGKGKHRGSKRTPTTSSGAKEEEVEAGRTVRTLDVTLRDALLPKGVASTFAELQLGERAASKSATVWGERAPVYSKAQHYTAVERDETLQIRVYEVKKKGKPPKLVAVAELSMLDLIANEDRSLRLELHAAKDKEEKDDRKDKGKDKGKDKDKDKERDKEEKEEVVAGKALGECYVGVEYRFTERTLLADAYYDDFLRVLMEPNFAVCRLLERLVEETGAAGVAYPLVHVLTHYSQMHLYLENWIGRELSRSDDTAVLFRGDSLGIKAFDVFLSWIGRQYLQETLGPHIERVVREQLPCELQEAKLEKTDRLRENFSNFLAEATKLTQSIFTSDYEAPAEFCYLFGALTQQVMEKFPYKLEVSVIAINGFLFLRFFVPAIMTPSLHGLWDGDLPPRPASTLNLLARVVQKLANMNLFDRDREPHLHLLNDFLRSQQKEISLFAGKLAERKIRKETLARVHRVPDPTLDITNEVVELVAVFTAHLAWWEQHKDVPEVARLLKALRKLRRLERRLQMRLSSSKPSRTNGGALSPQTPRDAQANSTERKD